jgi:hypothetical protein
MNNDEINDKREISEFRKLTFSGYARGKVKKELLNSIIKSDIEPACHWSSELICSGLFEDLWEIIILYMSRYIYSSNPKLPIYIDMRFDIFKQILISGYSDNILKLRNNEKIRKLFAELISILCFSRKKHAFESLTIKDANEFDITKLTSKLKAPNINYASNCFTNEDPKELLICINEFAYHISKDSMDLILACYWLEWLIDYDTVCRTKKIVCLAERRSFAPVDSKLQMDLIWIVWDAIISESNKKDSATQKIIKSLLNIFSIKYSVGVKKRRKYVLYFACSLLTDKIDKNIPFIQQKDKVEMIVKKINILYREIKKNEITPDTDYLFNGLEKSNFDKTIEKLDKLRDNDIF